LLELDFAAARKHDDGATLKEKRECDIGLFDGFVFHCSTALETHLSFPQKAAHRDLDGGR